MKGYLSSAYFEVEKLNWQMRLLRLTEQHTDLTWPTDRASALPLLRGLATIQPLPLAPTNMERLFRFIVAMTTQPVPGAGR